MDNTLYRFSDNLGSFESRTAGKIRVLYFPLANDKLISSISPDLHGDIKSGQDSFLLSPVSRIDLINLRSSRNFWVYINAKKIWSATGVSKDLRGIQEDEFKLSAGLLWHQVERSNKRIGLKAEILSFVPTSGEPVEVMQVKITNITSRKIEFIPTAAIPIYARSADNLRDHRHVTSLLGRIIKHRLGVITKPALVFNECGHRKNKDIYFVLGWDGKFNPPQYLYPTQEIFCGEGGDLEAPQNILKNKPPINAPIQGREAMGGLRFRKVSLAAGKSQSYIILAGIVRDAQEIKKIIRKFNTLAKTQEAFLKTKNYWLKISQNNSLYTGNADFNNWFRWVSIQPDLRRIFGCSFLPDFDYGKGGRGWRDLWQDCLGLILNNPGRGVRDTLINNFSGVRIDGSNATIIGKKEREFIADRNNISRTWMDHGLWPLLTLDLYLNETGDLDILFKETTYFRDQHLLRSAELDRDWGLSSGNRLKTSSGKIYKGSVLEHLLLENLVQFFNVGRHNYIRLEGADWNDGLDMARENGESVAFSAMYASNLGILSDLLHRIGRRKIRIAKELGILLLKVDYSNTAAKRKALGRYLAKTKSQVCGEKIDIDSLWLASDLKAKAEWMAGYIRMKEWTREGFFNGYYDNKGKRLEGVRKGLLRMTLASQVFPIMSGIASRQQVCSVLKNIERHLFDRRLKGYHLNTDFKAEQPDLGRAFSFVYGDKENGAFFSHMVVMFAYALYKRGYVDEGWKALSSIYNMAMDTARSRIYPCIPEYFDITGRGMYSYLTGSASWFVLTMLTQVFGLSGKYGDLLVEPKLSAEQFARSPQVSVNRIFAGRHLKVTFFNPKGLSWQKYRIMKARLGSFVLPVNGSSGVIIPKKMILGLPPGKVSNLTIVLG